MSKKTRLQGLIAAGIRAGGGTGYNPLAFALGNGFLLSSANDMQSWTIPTSGLQAGVFANDVCRAPLWTPPTGVKTWPGGRFIAGLSLSEGVLMLYAYDPLDIGSMGFGSAIGSLWTGATFGGGSSAVNAFNNTAINRFAVNSSGVLVAAGINPDPANTSGEKGQCILSSPTGQTWTSPTTPCDFSNYAGPSGLGQAATAKVACNGTTFVAVVSIRNQVGGFASTTTTVMHSTNGTSWTAASTQPLSGTVGLGPVDVAWNGTVFCLTGSAQGSTTAQWTSTDGNTWSASPASPADAGQGNMIATNGTDFLVAGNLGGTQYLFYGTGTGSWTTIPVTSVNIGLVYTTITAIGWDSNSSRWMVAVGGSTNPPPFISVSSNLSSWAGLPTSPPSSTPNQPHVVVGGLRYLAA